MNNLDKPKAKGQSSVCYNKLDTYLLDLYQKKELFVNLIFFQVRMKHLGLIFVTLW